MKPLKEDLLIVKENNLYQIFYKKNYLWIFYKWMPLTYRDTDNSDEQPIIFKTLKEANNFIEIITI